MAKVRDVVGLYLNPPERALVLCVDEKTQIQALNRTQPIFPMLPGTPARASHDYVRHGTSSLYAALDLTTGKVIGCPALSSSGHRVPGIPQKDRRRSPRRAPGPRQRLHAQDPSGKAMADKPSPVTHTSIRQLNTDIRAWIDTWNDNPRPYVCGLTPIG